MQPTCTPKLFCENLLPPTKNALLRYAALDACLRRPNRRWTFEALREAVADAVNEQLGISTGVSTRTLRLDLQAMRPGGATGYEAPIEYSPERGYYYDPPTYSIFNNPLTLDDLSVLQQALGTLRQLQGLHLSGELDELVARLEQRVSMGAAADQPAIIQFEQAPDYAGLPWLGPLYQAIRGQRAQWLTYAPFGAAPERRELVHPHLLKQYNQRWFLLAGAPATGRAATLYALDRIRSLEPAADVAYQAGAVAPETFFSDLIGVSIPADPTPQRIELRFAAARLPYILTKPLHSSQLALPALPDATTGANIQLTLIPTRELVTLLLSFGADVEVLAPATLRAEVAEGLRRAAGPYA